MEEPTTPNVMSNNASRLIKKINPVGQIKSKYIDFTKPNSFEPYEQECYYNVAKMIDLHGGGPVYGWVIWESSTMIEGEAHCLYKDPDGSIFDITPRVSGEMQVLFVEDSRINISLRHVEGTKFSMVQYTNPKLQLESGAFLSSKPVSLTFDQSEIRVIKLIEFQDSFLFQ